MGDWEQFLAAVPGFAPGGGVEVVVGEPQAWTRGSIDLLPILSRLLADATLTAVTVGERSYELLAWGPDGGRRGWLCPVPEPGPVEGLHPVHRDLLAVCGGIVERFGEPTSWWLNQDEVLTRDLAVLAVGPVIDDYSWLWDDEGLEIPTGLGDFVGVALEANGNLTMAHRETGQIVLFAPDHAFDEVTPLPGCPEYSLMTLDQAPDLVAWIESCATAWADS